MGLVPVFTPPNLNYRAFDMTDQAVKSYEHGTNIQAHGYKLNSKFGSLSTTDRLSLLFIILL